MDYVEGLPALTDISETVAATVGFSRNLRDALTGTPIAGVPSQSAWDTDWQNLEVNTAVWTAVSGYTPQFRRWGPLVFIRGRVTGTAAAGNNTFATVPDGWGARPGQIMEAGPVPHGSASSGRFYITVGGVLSSQGMTGGNTTVYLSSMIYCL